MAVTPVSGPTYNTEKGARFRLPGDPGNDEYWVKVDKDPPHSARLYQSQPGIILDKDVGTINPKTGEIEFNDRLGGATNQQRRLLSDKDGPAMQTIRDQIGHTVQQELHDGGRGLGIPESRVQAAQMVGNDGSLLDDSEQAAITQARRTRAAGTPCAFRIPIQFHF